MDSYTWFYSSTSLSRAWMESISMKRPCTAITVKAKDNHTSPIDAIPTSPTTLVPCAVLETMATTDAAATCCHRADIIKSSEAKPSANKTPWATGREGNGLMSMAEPVRGSTSSCHPGKVASPRKPKNVKATAPTL
jgi:hypothetical protein